MEPLEVSEQGRALPWIEYIYVKCLGQWLPPALKQEQRARRCACPSRPSICPSTHCSVPQDADLSGLYQPTHLLAAGLATGSLQQA